MLTVCLGNICRPPTAYGVFQHPVDTAGYSDMIRVDSAGTGGYHIGERPGEGEAFQLVLNLVEEASDALLEHMRIRHLNG